MFIPELLAPAGNLDKLKVAISYGANAIYVGGLKFGLRSAADNFTDHELLEGVLFSHAHNAKVYVVLNGFLHDPELPGLIKFIKYIEKINVDAVIVSDLGVIETVKTHSSLEIHLSTQASCLNSASAKLWKKMGVSRIVLGREVSLEEAALIKREGEIEVEMFIHGSMCMAYSGNCVISNFTQGRDSNRGGCAHSCRFEYSISFDKKRREKKTGFFMSSKDLNGLSLLEKFIEAGIDCIKIEGRMKSHLYVATMSKIYSEALAFYKENGALSAEKLLVWQEELEKVVHRSYAPVNLISKAQEDTIYDERKDESIVEYILVGRVLSVVKKESIIIEVKNAFELGQELEILPFTGDVKKIQLDFIRSLKNEPILRTNPTTIVKIPFVEGCAVSNIVRKKK